MYGNSFRHHIHAPVFVYFARIMWIVWLDHITIRNWTWTLYRRHKYTQRFSLGYIKYIISRTIYMRSLCAIKTFFRNIWVCVCVCVLNNVKRPEDMDILKLVWVFGRNTVIFCYMKVVGHLRTTRPVGIFSGLQYIL